MEMQFLNSVLSPGWQNAATDVAIVGVSMYVLILGFALVMGRRYRRNASR